MDKFFPLPVGMWHTFTAIVSKDGVYSAPIGRCSWSISDPSKVGIFPLENHCRVMVRAEGAYMLKVIDESGAEQSITIVSGSTQPDVLILKETR